MARRTRPSSITDWPAAGDVYTPVQRAALALCDTMTRSVQVDAATLDHVRQHLGERQTVELVATIASYNMVSRFLEALHIHGTDAR
jgi:alkylhydroperoxidase family enzyme